MPTVLGTVAAAINAGGLIETVAWSSDFSEYPNGTPFLPETGWESNDWDDGGHTVDSQWVTHNTGGSAFLRCSSASAHLHYDGLIENHEVEVDVKVIAPTCLAGPVLAVSSADPLLYVGIELVYIESTPENKLVGYVRWNIAGTPTEEFFYNNLDMDFVPGNTYTLRARILDNFVTVWLDGVIVSGYQLSSAQVPDIDGHTRCGVIHFSTVGAADFDNLELRGLQHSGAPQLPLAPIYLEGTPAATSVSLTWMALSANITNYVVQYALASAPTSWTTFSHAASAVAAINVTGLTVGTAYIFRVAAVTAVGQGSYSEVSDEITTTITGPPTTDLILHLEADALTLANNDPVSTWTATVGPNLTQTSTNRPLYITSGIGGLPTVRFDGSNDYMIIPSGWSTWTAGFTWFFVLMTTTVSGTKKILMFGNGSNTTMEVGRLNATGSNHVFNGSGAVRFGNSSASLFAANTPFVLSFHNPAGTANASNTATYRKNNVAWGTADSYVPPVTTRPTNYLGVSVYGSEFWAGDISEVVVYNRALTEGEISDVYAYLNTKYGL